MVVLLMGRKWLGWLQNFDLKDDPSVPFVTVSFRILISLNVTNCIPETVNDNYENVIYLLEHLWHWEIPRLSPSLLPPQRILVKVSGKCSLISGSCKYIAIANCTTTVLPSKGCIHLYCATSMDSLIIDVTSEVVFLDCSVATYQAG